MDVYTDDLTLGRGKIYFDRFADGTFNGTGERFLGNAPTVQLAQQNQQLDHYKSTSGLKTKDRTVTLQNDHTATFSCESIDVNNMALWFLGNVDKETVASPTAETWNTTANLGTYTQIGADDTRPQGYRNVTGVSVKKGSTAVTASGNYEVDLVNGRIYWESTATDVEDGDAVEIDFTPSAGTNIYVIDASIQIFGALRFISDNPVGSNKDYFWPYVQLSASGQIDLIADTWQTMQFSASVLQKNDQVKRYYVTQR